MKPTIILGENYDPSKFETVPVAQPAPAPSYEPIPEWVSKIETVEMTQGQINALPEYSATLPDSYKRPISEGGRPWKRDLNFFRRFAAPDEKIWIYCEYIPDPDPAFLAILNKRVVVRNATSERPPRSNPQTNPDADGGALH